MADNRQVAERFAECVIDRDIEGIAELLHPDLVAKYPQSGEVFRGKDNYVAMLSHYPQGLPEADVTETHGGQQEVHVSTPIPFAIPRITVTGSGDTFILEGEAGPYPDGIVYKMVSIGKFRDGKLAEETSYFAAPFDPPEWRQPFVE